MRDRLQNHSVLSKKELSQNSGGAIGMPNMDGYMLIQQVRALPSEQGGQIPTIALTAYAGEMNQQQAIAAGFQRHLAKPVEPEELIRTIMALRTTHPLSTT